MLISRSNEDLKIMRIGEYKLTVLPSALPTLRKSWQESKTSFLMKSYGSMKLSDLEGMPMPRTGITGGGSCYAVSKEEAKPKGGLVSPLGEVRRYCPTPSTMDMMTPRSETAMERWRTREGHGSIAPACLKEWVHPEMWPTPTAQTTGRTLEQYENYLDKHRNGIRRAVHLEIAVQLWPTPSASEHKARLHSQASKSLGALMKNQLNPDWVEWLMGFPPLWSKADMTILAKIKKAGIKLV